MTKLNLQDAFNLAYNGLKAQGFEKSMKLMRDVSGATGEGCAYRGLNGRKCAIGHCIPDELYQEKFEQSKASKIIAYLEKNGHELLTDVASIQIDELQECHDCASSPENMKDRLVTYARNNALTIPE